MSLKILIKDLELCLFSLTEVDPSKKHKTVYLRCRIYNMYTTINVFSEAKEINM